LYAHSLVYQDQYVVDAEDDTIFISVYSEDENFGYNGAIVAGFGILAWTHLTTNPAVIVTFYSVTAAGGCISPVSVTSIVAQIYQHHSGVQPSSAYCDNNIRNYCPGNIYNLSAAPFPYPPTGLFSNLTGLTTVCGYTEDELLSVPGSSVLLSTISAADVVNGPFFVSITSSNPTYGYITFGQAPLISYIPPSGDMTLSVDWAGTLYCNFNNALTPVYDIILI